MSEDGSTVDNLRRDSEAEWLLREFAHRTSNEIAAALAALHVTRNAPRPSAQVALMTSAIARLENFGDVHRLLAEPLRGEVDVSAVLGRLCRGLAGARISTDGSDMTLSLPPIHVDAVTARRMALIAVEIVTNAMRHALAGRHGSLSVSLSDDPGEIVLTVIDDGPGLHDGAASSGTGYGRGIVAELAARAGGTIEYRSGNPGTRVRVALPVFDGRYDDHVPF